jgi:diaminopimelate epimerase
MEITFSKMHGTLNDFVVFHDLKQSIALSAEHVRRLCDRRAGIGADGVIVVRQSAAADFFMDYINADGSLAEMCGNGIRCLAKYAYDRGLTDKTTLPVETRAGIKTLDLITGSDGSVDRVRVDMGKPAFEPANIPVNLSNVDTPIMDFPLEVDGTSFRVNVVSMGNPHCVIVLDKVPEHFPRHFGPLIEKHPLFPAKTNVEFIYLREPGRVTMKVWERGSGETWSCGTGACASMVVSALKGLVGDSATVELPGGDLEILWKGMGSHVIMTGPAVTVYSGNITM